MFYSSCPTCGHDLSRYEVPYKLALDEITNKLNNIDDISDEDFKLQYNTERSKLLDKLELKEKCCRMRVLGNVDLISIIRSKMPLDYKTYFE